MKSSKRILATARDITAQKQFQAELERLVAERTKSLQETTAKLNDFCYSIAHDLKAPIQRPGGLRRPGSWTNMVRG